MKTTFDNSTVAHVWAQQSQAYGKGSHLWFQNETIYSYSTPIGMFVKNADGQEAVLISANNYSVSTAKHLSYVSHAVNHKNLISCGKVELNSHESNFKYWLNKAEQQAEKLKTARKPEKYLNELQYISADANKYADFFGVAIPETLKQLFAIENSADFSGYLENKETILKAERIKAEKALKVQHKKELAKWLKGETHRLYTRNGQDYLRMGENTVETTQGVRIPLNEAKTFWQAIVNNTVTVGNEIQGYEVSEVTAKAIRIGCHTFERNYLVNFGNQLFETVNA